MKGTVIYYKCDDSEFGEKIVVDNVVLTSEEAIKARIAELKDKIAKDYYKTLRFINCQEVEIKL